MEELDVVDDLALQANNHNRAAKHSVNTARNINSNRSKTKIMKANIKNDKPITLKGKPPEEADSFIYVDSTIKKNGGT